MTFVRFVLLLFGLWHFMYQGRCILIDKNIPHYLKIRGEELYPASYSLEVLSV